MRPSARGSLVWLALACACFVDPPGVDPGTSTGSTADSETGSTSPSSDTQTATLTVTASTDDSLGSSGTGSSASATTDTTAADESSTGDPPIACGCPADYVFCDGFEAWPGPWTDPGGDGTVAQDQNAPHCGLALGRTDVATGDHVAVISAAMATTGQAVIATPHSWRAFVHATPSCAGPEFARIVQLQLRQTGATGQWYSWEVAIKDGQLRLTGTNHTTAAISWAAQASLSDVWTELRVDFDLAARPPTAVLSVDGEPLVQSDAQSPPLSDAALADLASPTVVLGPYLYDAPFPGECAVLYDDVWFAPT